MGRSRGNLRVLRFDDSRDCVVVDASSEAMPPYCFPPLAHSCNEEYTCQIWRIVEMVELHVSDVPRALVP